MPAASPAAVADAAVAARLARRRQSAWLAAGELALVVSVFVADRHQLVPLSKTPFLLIIGWLSLGVRGLRWRDVGFVAPAGRTPSAQRPQSKTACARLAAFALSGWFETIALGVAAGIAMELFALFVSEPWFARLAGREPDLSDFRPLVGNLRLLLLLLAPVWIGSALEELVYRGYLMNRVAGLGSFTRTAWIASLVIVSAFFGVAHAESQGVTGMLQEGFAGLLLGVVYLGCSRTLAVPMVAHAASNTLAFVLIYVNRYPGV